MMRDVSHKSRSYCGSFFLLQDVCYTVPIMKTVLLALGFFILLLLINAFVGGNPLG